VSLVAYRESDCHATLAALFKAAAAPHRVFAGVCEQRLLPNGSAEDCAPERLPPALQNNVGSFRRSTSLRLTLEPGPYLPAPCLQAAVCRASLLNY